MFSLPRPKKSSSPPNQERENFDQNKDRLAGRFAPLSGTKVTDNGGSVFLDYLKDKPKNFAGAKNDLQVSSDGRKPDAKSEPAAVNEIKRVNGPKGQAPDWLRNRYASEIDTRERLANYEAAGSSKPIGLMLDAQTRAIVKAMPSRDPIGDTAKKYRRAHELMIKQGKTPGDKANSRAHFDFLRSAWRFGELEAIRELRAASERLNRHEDKASKESAKRKTRRAWERAVMLEAHTLEGWKAKANQMKARGQKPVKNSKRFGPKPGSPTSILLNLEQESPRAFKRHGERIAVLALFGCRPIELDGATIEAKNGKLIAWFKGAKVNATRGQPERSCAVLLSEGGMIQSVPHRFLADQVKKAGGKLVLTTSDADIQSLRHVLSRIQPGLSPYSFRHQVASDLKASEMEDKEVSAWMGHRSTGSIEYYGRKASGHSKGPRKALASMPVREVPHTQAQKFQARAAKKRKIGIGSVPQIRMQPQPQPRASVPSNTWKPRPPRMR